MERVEEQTGTNPHEWIYPNDGVTLPYNTVWTVRIWRRPEWADWALQGREHHLEGLVVPATEPRIFKSLAKARDEAEWLFATLTSNMFRVPWPYRVRERAAL